MAWFRRGRGRHALGARPVAPAPDLPPAVAAPLEPWAVAPHPDDLVGNIAALIASGEAWDEPGAAASVTGGPPLPEAASLQVDAGPQPEVPAPAFSPAPLAVAAVELGPARPAAAAPSALPHAVEPSLPLVAQPDVALPVTPSVEAAALPIPVIAIPTSATPTTATPADVATSQPARAALLRLETALAFGADLLPTPPASTPDPVRLPSVQLLPTLPELPQPPVVTASAPVPAPVVHHRPAVPPASPTVEHLTPAPVPAPTAAPTALSDLADAVASERPPVHVPHQAAPSTVPAPDPVAVSGRVSLGFRDGSTTQLDPDSEQAAALEELALLLSLRD